MVRAGVDFVTQINMIRKSRPVTLTQMLAGKTPTDNVRVTIGKKIFTFSHLNRVLFPADGITKLDVMRYYYDVRKAMLPYLKERPLTLRRFPTGIGGLKFYQHDLEHAPTELTRKKIFAKTEGIEKNYAFANDIGDLLYLVNIGCIGQHPYLCRFDALDKPDYVAFDLDPQAKVSFDGVLEVALAMKKLLDELGSKCYAKTSGATGMHVFVPIRRSYTFAQTSRFAKEIADALVRQLPKLATTARSVKSRNPSHVYIDYLQNLYGKSMAAPYSLRERPGAPVSMPVTWREVRNGFSPEDFNIRTAVTRLKQKKDIFNGVLSGRQALPKG